MVQGTTPMCGAGNPWQPNCKPKLVERSNCYGEKRVLQNGSKSSCCPGHFRLAGICSWFDCQSNRTQNCALVGCQGPALSYPFTKWTQNNTIQRMRYKPRLLQKLCTSGKSGALRPSHQRPRLKPLCITLCYAAVSPPIGLMKKLYKQQLGRA